MRPPVVRVAAKDEFLSVLPAFDEERTACDRLAGLGIADPVDPDLRDVFAPEGVRRKDVPEVRRPVGLAWAENQPNGLCVHRPDAANGAVPLPKAGIELPEHAQREDEIARRHRYAVAPACFPADVVRQSERRLPCVVDANDELRAPLYLGPDIVRALQHEVVDASLRDPRCTRNTSQDGWGETGWLGSRLCVHERSAALRRLRGRAARCRDREERGGERRC